jgi:uncharacterized protein (TIGR02231 family)
MNYKNLILSLSVLICFTSSGVVTADEKIYQSRIIDVKLFQNQAEIVRTVVIPLKKGSNNIVLGGLPNLLYDWSIKGGLPKDFNGKIVSLEVEKKALVQKRRKNILDIEEKLLSLREQDLAMADDLKNISAQEKLLNSIGDFTGQTIPREIATKIPKISTWDETINYIFDKKKDLFNKKRKTEREREKLGKEIQKWEFELSQIAGYTYYSNYQTLNNAYVNKRQNEAVQQYYDFNDKYAERNRLLKEPTENVDYEKRVNMIVYSSSEKEIEFTLTYVIPKTYWQMVYDLRASFEKNSVNLSVFGNIFQNSGEDWDDVNLALSTGAPINSMTQPSILSWILDVYERETSKYDSYSGSKEKSASPSLKKRAKKNGGASGGAADMEISGKDEESTPPSAVISEKGIYFGITLPLKQSIVSSIKYQKKFIQDYEVTDKANVKFYYELVPQYGNKAYLKVKLFNTTGIPLMAGESQVFLENEYMGKIRIPYMPIGKSENLVIGNETRITGFKELLKKFEDTSGVFGGKRKISYKYKLTVENQMPKKGEITLLDIIPVTRNKKIDVEIKDLSLPVTPDKEFEASTEYSQGIRKWNISLGPKEKKEITYEIIISFDKDLSIGGLR